MIAVSSWFYETTPEYQKAFDDGYEYAKAQMLAITSKALVEMEHAGQKVSATFTARRTNDTG